MKFLTTLLIFISFSAFGQSFSQAPVQFDKKNTYQALGMSIDADYELVADRWEDFWQQRYDVDFDKLDKGKASLSFSAEQASIPLISDKNADMFSKIAGTSTSASVNLAIIFTTNDIVTARTHPQSYQAAESVMREFRTAFYTSYFDEQLAELRDQLADLRDDSSDATDDAAKARKKIQKYEDKIEKYRRKIEKERAAVGDELETAEEKAEKASDLAKKIRELERRRARYLN